MRSRNAFPRIFIYFYGIIGLSLRDVLYTRELQEGNLHVNHDRTAYV
jgi:hypothetical protein